MRRARLVKSQRTKGKTMARTMKLGMAMAVLALSACGTGAKRVGLAPLNPGDYRELPPVTACAYSGAKNHVCPPQSTDGGYTLSKPVLNGTKKAPD